MICIFNSEITPFYGEIWAEPSIEYVKKIFYLNLSFSKIKSKPVLLNVSHI